MSYSDSHPGSSWGRTGLTTSNVTGTRATGPAGGNAQGMGAPGNERFSHMGVPLPPKPVFKPPVQIPVPAAYNPPQWGPLPSELTDWPGRPGSVPVLGPHVNWGPTPGEATDWPGRPGTVPGQGPGNTIYKTPAPGRFIGADMSGAYGNNRYGIGVFGSLGGRMSSDPGNGSGGVGRGRGGGGGNGW